MRKSPFIIFLIALLMALAGCGYTTSSTLPSNFKTIYVEKFENKVNFATERTRNLYFPNLEIDVLHAISDRYLFDGNLRISQSDAADLVLKGKLLSYDRDALRITDNEDPEEYRIHVTVSLELWDTSKQEMVWSEASFTGESTYFVSGPQARSESDAVQDAVKDLARRVVERTIENW